jgi:hypothetical protein
MRDILALRKEMSEEGWASEDKLTYMGWGGVKYGYSIWFSRWNWHGKPHDKVCFHAHTSDISKMAEIAERAASLARRAWSEYPDFPPAQDAKGELIVVDYLRRASQLDAKPPEGV